LSLELAIQYGKLNVVHGSAFLKLYSEYQRNAEKGGRTFLLDTDLFRQLTTSSCHYCGAPPSRVKKRSDESYVYNGIDRIDNAKGYEPENVVPCCWECNKSKGSKSYDDFMAWIKRIADFHNNRTESEYSLSPFLRIYEELNV
jgi:5-methylcytosine-specific restriction endonuclease McrA